MDSRRVAVIGAGSVGRALAIGLAGAGHQVVVGVRDPGSERAAAVAAVLGADRVVAPAAATADADAAILAVPVDALGEAVPGLGLTDGAVLVDATNAVMRPPPAGFHTVGAYVASLAPRAAVVKAFNTIGAEHLGDGRVGRQRAFLPVAGADEGRPLVVGLAESLGFDVADLGGPDAVGLVEDHARLWIHLAMRCGWGRQFGFAVVRP